MNASPCQSTPPLLVGDPPIEAKRLDVVQRCGVEAEMLLEQRASQVAGDGGVPDRGVHLGRAAQGIGVKVTGADRRPGVVDDHQLAMDVDRPALLTIQRGDADEAKARMAPERLEPVEQRASFRVLARGVDMIFRDRRHEQHDFDAARQCALQANGDAWNRDRLVLDIDRALGRIDRALVLFEDRPLARRQHALDLHGAGAARLGRAGGKRQFVGAVARPVAVRRVSLAGARSSAATKLCRTSVADGPVTST